MRNTIDKKILDAIHKKDMSQKALLNAIEASIDI